MHFHVTNAHRFIYPQVRDSSRSGQLLGSALLHVAAAKDGTTLFWAVDASGRPLGARWGAADPPWRLSLPLEGCETAGELVLGVSVDPWTYKQPLLASAYRWERAEFLTCCLHDFVWLCCMDEW